VASAARLLAHPARVSPAVRWALVAKLGRIRSRRRGKKSVGEFYLDFRPVGRVWTNHGVRITDEATAQRLLEKIRDQVSEEVSLEEVLARYQPASAPANLVSTWLERWIDLRRREMNAGSLSPNFVRELERLVAPGGHFSFFDRVSIHDVTYGLLEDWSLWLADRKQSPKSRRNFLGYMRSFLRWLELRGEIRKAPRVPSVRVEEHEPRILSIADQDRILAHISEAERGIFLALAHLGLRPGEARALQVADYRDGWLHVDKAAKSKSVSAEIRGTKTGKPKRLPVSEELADWIARHVDPTGRFSAAPLFPNPRTGRMWPHKALGRVWSRALEAAEFPHVSLYEGTKHTMATDAIRRGVPERALQRFLGHASVQSTRRYARLADNALIEVLRPASRRDDAPATRSGDKLATRVPEPKLSRSKDFGVGPPGFEPGGRSVAGDRMAHRAGRRVTILSNGEPRRGLTRGRPPRCASGGSRRRGAGRGRRVAGPGRRGGRSRGGRCRSPRGCGGSLRGGAPG